MSHSEIFRLFSGRFAWDHHSLTLREELRAFPNQEV